MNTNCAFDMVNCDKKKIIFDSLIDSKVIFVTKTGEEK